jgi:hypothetical protein
MKLGAALANNDAPALYGGAIKGLDAETLRVRVTTVPG